LRKERKKILNFQTKEGGALRYVEGESRFSPVSTIRRERKFTPLLDEPLVLEGREEKRSFHSKQSSSVPANSITEKTPVEFLKLRRPPNFLNRFGRRGAPEEHEHFPHASKPEKIYPKGCKLLVCG